MKLKMTVYLLLVLGLGGLFLTSGCRKGFGVPTEPGGHDFRTATPTATSTGTPLAPPRETATPTATLTVTVTLTATTTPHTTPTVTVPTSGIFWYPGMVAGSLDNSATSGWLNLSVNGAPETTAAVTLSTPHGNIPFSYQTSYGLSAIYGTSTPIGTYVPGGTYTLTSVTSIGTATATLIAPGGNEVIAPDGSTASWDVEGNEDYVTVYKTGFFFTTQTTGDISSPFTVPGTAYPTPGNYEFILTAQSSTYNVMGAAPGSRFTIYQDYNIVSVNR